MCSTRQPRTHAAGKLHPMDGNAAHTCSETKPTRRAGKTGSATQGGIGKNKKKTDWRQAYFLTPLHHAHVSGVLHRTRHAHRMPLLPKQHSSISTTTVALLFDDIVSYVTHYNSATETKPRQAAGQAKEQKLPNPGRCIIETKPHTASDEGPKTPKGSSCSAKEVKKKTKQAHCKEHKGRKLPAPS